MELSDDAVADLLAFGRTACEGGAQMIDDFIGAHGEPHPNEVQQACALVLCRCVADVRAGALLSTSCYPSQIASVMRATHESMCLVKMFLEEPDEAKVWWTGNKRYHVQEIRRRAKLDEGHPFEEVYSYLCGLSHPRSEGIDTQLSGQPGGKGVVSTGPMFYSNPRVLDAGYLVVTTLVEVADVFRMAFPLANDAPDMDDLVARLRKVLRDPLEAYAAALIVRDPDNREMALQIAALIRHW